MKKPTLTEFCDVMERVCTRDMASIAESRKRGQVIHNAYFLSYSVEGEPEFNLSYEALAEVLVEIRALIAESPTYVPQRWIEEGG